MYQKGQTVALRFEKGSQSTKQSVQRCKYSPIFGVLSGTRVCACDCIGKCVQSHILAKMMVGELIAFFKAIIIILLKLILLFLKKRHKDQHQSETNNDSGFGSPTPSSSNDEEFDLSSELDAEISRLRTENKALRDIISKDHFLPRSDFGRSVVTSACGRRGTSLTDVSRHPDFGTSTPRSTTTDVGFHDVVCQKLMLKLQLEREENGRLQNYINDIMYMVLENSHSLLEK